MEAEFFDIDKKAEWGLLYQEIRNECNNYDYTYKEAKKVENKNLNRYRDVSPYDHSRVKLIRGNSDYINASLVQVPSARRSYILAQGPLPHTTGHFWQMVWEQNSKAVLMLNKVIEKNQVKCHQYWPLGKQHGGEDELYLPDVGLKIEYIRETTKSFYTVRELQLFDLESGNSRIVQHFHYTTWPDFGVPQSPSAFLTFLLAVRRAGVLDENVGPPVVHCSAGIGRSGTFCLVDSCLILIEKHGSIDSINIKDILLDMRRYRMGLIQTPDQLRFSYLAIIEGAKKVLGGTFKELVDEENNQTLDNISDQLINHNNIEELDKSPPLPPKCKKYETETSHKPFHAGADPDDYLPSYQNQSIYCALDQAISDAEVRRRLRRERNEKTAEKVEQMKKRQQDSEKWRKRRSILKPLSIGLLILFGSSLVVYKFLL